MKVYTFDALDSTRVEILWSLRPKTRDRIFEKFIHQSNYTEVNFIQECEIAIYPYRVFQPETLEFDYHVYEAAELAQKYNKPLILDATSDSDVFLNIPTAHILRCGLYKSLKKPFETESPFWSNYRTKSALDSLEINSTKASKPTIGFCGTTSSMGKLSNLSKSLLPTSVAKTVLSQGKLASQIDIRLREGMSLKLRETAMKLLTLDKRLNTDFEVTNNYQSYYNQDKQNRILLEDLFIQNMNKCDYTLCVRGTGNYSGRFYMTINAGRIPIVIDTDIVIPYEDKLNIIKIPVDSLDRIGDIVLEHYENTTEQELTEMKMQNREVYNQYIAPEKFFPSFLDGILS